MKIGESVLIGRRGVINTGCYLEIGAYTITGPNVYIGDVDHNYRNNLTHPILLQGITEGRKLVVEENCWLAMNCVVTGNLTIGRGSVVGANSVLNRDVPVFSVVDGNPAKILRMYDPIEEDWIRVIDKKDMDAVLKNREIKALPSRKEYKKLLDKHGFKRVPPTVSGPGIRE